MTTDELRTIQIDGRTFSYVFRSTDPTEPLLVVLHGHNKEPRPSKLKSNNCNVLCPVDNFGLNGCGSWYLGEDGDFFWLNAMKEIIANVYSGNEVYFLGSSMGGYGAILHGALNNAIGVYANIPQTKLLGSAYDSQGMGRYFSHVFGGTSDSVYNDLRGVIHRGCKTHFDITAIRGDKKGYLKEQLLDFVSYLTEVEVSFSFEVFNQEGHGLVMPLHDAAERLLARIDLLRESDDSSDHAVDGSTEEASETSIASEQVPNKAAFYSRDSLRTAMELFAATVHQPEGMWTDNKAHMALRFESFIARYGATLGTSCRERIVEDVLQKANLREKDRPLTVFITNPGGCGSHWLQAVLTRHFQMSGCGEAYISDSAMRFISDQAEPVRSYFLDCIHLIHSYDGANTLERAALINTAHASGWLLSSAMSAPKLRIVLVRDPVDTAISRTFRKQAHRDKYFPLDNDEAYLERNLSYIEKFYSKFRSDKFDVLVRYEDMRSNMRSVVEKIEEHASSFSRGNSIESTLSYFDESSGGQTNKFAGDPPVIPQLLKEHAALQLAELRKKLGYLT